MRGNCIYFGYCLYFGKSVTVPKQLLSTGDLNNIEFAFIFAHSSHLKLLSALDSSWAVNASNGLQAHGHPHWLQLQLAAAKLLDLALLLPAHRLPQFQM